MPLQYCEGLHFAIIFSQRCGNNRLVALDQDVEIVVKPHSDRKNAPALQVFWKTPVRLALGSAETTQSYSNSGTALKLAGLGTLNALPVAQFHYQQRRAEEERHSIRQDDGQRVDHEAVAHP